MKSIHNNIKKFTIYLYTYFFIKCYFFFWVFTAFSVSDSHSQEPTEFAAQLGFSEDSNSQSSEPPPAKQIKTE